VVGDGLKEEGLPFPENSFDVVYCSAVYHLVNREKSIQLTKNVFSVLKSKKEGGSGGIFFGKTGGSGVADPIEMLDERNGIMRYMHTPDSMKQMFESVGFQDVQVVKGLPDMAQGERLGARTENRSFLSFTAYKY